MIMGWSHDEGAAAARDDTTIVTVGLRLSSPRHANSLLNGTSVIALIESQIASRTLMSWIYLGAAILLEVAGITSMKLSRGFSEPLPSIAVPVLYVFSAVAVILALKKLDLSTTYAIWSGVGTALAAMIGVAYFREPLTLLKIASIALVIIGVIGLSLPTKPVN
jgi:small multidrug resistance pump